MPRILNASDFLDSDFFTAKALEGSVSNDGETYSSSVKPNATLDETKEYYEFTLYFKPNNSRSVIEFAVPDCYMGMDIWEGSTSKTGDAHYTLSVPYAWNLTGAPPKDWGTLSLSNGSGADGTIKRIQLASDNAASTAITCRVYYATEPAVGFDGVNDYVSVADDASLDLTTAVTGSVTIKFFYLGASNAWISKGTSYRFYTSPTRCGIEAINWVDRYFTCDVDLNLQYNWMTLTGIFNGSYCFYYVNGAKLDSQAEPNPIAPNDEPLIIGAQSATYYKCRAAISTLSLYNVGSDSPDLPTEGCVLLLNASSFSGSSDTTVTDFSGAGNHGTAYGGVQYKVYNDTGFKATIIGMRYADYSADSALKKYDIGKNYSSDVWLMTPPIPVFYTGSAVIKKIGAEKSYYADATLFRTYYLDYSADAYLGAFVGELGNAVAEARVLRAIILLIKAKELG